MTNNHPNIFVIVVTYKGQLWYDRCFTSLRKSSIPVNTIVIDNGGDGTVEYLYENYPEIIVFPSSENLGFGRANNIGMRYALDHGCDYVFLLNQDAWIENDTIENLLSIHTAHLEYGILSPMHIVPDTGQLGMLLDDGKLNINILDAFYTGKINDVYRIRYVNAAAWFIPRKTLEMIGGFCPFIFHYGEDDDYINRMQYHKIPIGVCPKLKVYHDSGKPLPDREEFRTRAQREDINSYININIPINFRTMYWYFFRKYVLCFLRAKSKERKMYREKMHYLRANLGKLRLCRQQHIKLQSNWLYD